MLAETALSIADNMFMGREIRKPGIMGSVFRMLDRTAMEKVARDKLTELENCGIDQCVILPFNAQLAAQPPKAFIHMYKIRCSCRSIGMAYQLFLRQ